MNVLLLTLMGNPFAPDAGEVCKRLMNGFTQMKIRGRLYGLMHLKDYSIIGI